MLRCLPGTFKPVDSLEGPPRSQRGGPLAFLSNPLHFSPHLLFPSSVNVTGTKSLSHCYQSWSQAQEQTTVTPTTHSPPPPTRRRRRRAQISAHTYRRSSEWSCGPAAPVRS